MSTIAYEVGYEIGSLNRAINGKGIDLDTACAEAKVAVADIAASANSDDRILYQQGYVDGRMGYEAALDETVAAG